MALTQAQLNQIYTRLYAALADDERNYQESNAWAAIQAIDATFEGGGKTALNNAVEGAAPGAFNVSQKKKLLAAWMFWKLGV